MKCESITDLIDVAQIRPRTNRERLALFHLCHGMQESGLSVPEMDSIYAIIMLECRKDVIHVLD